MLATSSSGSNTHPSRRWVRLDRQLYAFLSTMLFFLCMACGDNPELAAYRIAVSIRQESTADIYIADGNGRLIDRVTNTPLTTEMWPTWSSSGKVMFFEATNNDSVMTFLMRKDIDSTVEDTIYGRPGRGGLWFTVSPDGEKVAYVVRHGYQTQLIIADTLGTKLLVVGEERVRLIRPEWNRDSRRILCQVKKRSAVQWDVALVDTETGTLERFMSTPDSSESRPAWSPNGKFIVYSSAPTEPSVSNDLVISNADGSAKKPLRVESRILLGSGTWSCNFSVAALRERPLPLTVLIWPEPWRSVELRRTELDGKWRHGRVVWSPDGKFLAVNVTHRRLGKAGGWSILILDAAGRIVKKWPQALDASCPAWAPLSRSDASS